MNESVSQIYVVDDDVSVREGVGRLIRSAGLNVKTFPTAQETIASLQQELPRCLVLDVQLPDINGFELQQQLAKKKAYRYRSSFSLVTATSHRVCVP